MHIILTGFHGTNYDALGRFISTQGLSCQVYNQEKGVWDFVTAEELNNQESNRPTCISLCHLCRIDDINTALDTLEDNKTELTVLSRLDTSATHQDSSELYGALLRASYCHDARVIICCDDPALSEDWIHDYVPVTLVSDVSHITPVIWRGELWQKDNSCYMEVSPLEDTINNVEDWTGAHMELMTPVKASSIHVCMLGASYTVKLIQAGNNSLELNSSQTQIVRMVTPLHHEKYEDFMTKHQIKTTDHWMAHVLKDSLIRTSCKPQGPVRYSYYLLSVRRGQDALLYDIDMGSLSSAMVSDEFLVPVTGNKVIIEGTESIYNKCRNIPLTGDELIMYLQALQRTVDLHVSDVCGDMVGLLSKPETWHEILALKEHSDRKDALAAQREKEDGKLSESPKDAICNTQDIISCFDVDGLPKDKKYLLPKGNRQPPGIEMIPWDDSWSYFGPGICYHQNDDTKVDPRLVIYRDRHGFDELASLYSTDVIPTVRTHKPMPAPQSKPTLNMAVRRSPRGKARAEKRVSKSINSNQKLHFDKPPETATIKKPASDHQIKEEKSDPSPAGGASSKSQTQTARAERAERNRRNIMKMKSAVNRALYKQGIKKDHEFYKEYSTELYELTMLGVKKLKTSENLEKRMKEIAEVYVTPAVTAVNMRSKREAAKNAKS